MVSLVLTLEPATIASSGRFGCASALVMASISAASSGPAQATLANCGDAVGAGLGAVRGAEGIVHEDVAQRRHLPRQRLVILLLALVDAAVLEQHDLAGLDVDSVDPVRAQRHVAAEQFTEARSHRRQRILGLEGAFGRPAQVRGHHHRRAGVERHADARHRGADARVFGDVAGVILRHVEVGADEDALAGDAALGDEVGESKDIHGAILEVTTRDRV